MCPPPRSAGESLARAAEVGLAEIGDLTREPREAIIACYAAMERELTRVPGAVPQDCDTPSEVLARAVDNRALRADSATELVELFEEARFSPHVMTRSASRRRCARSGTCAHRAPGRRGEEHCVKKLVAVGFLLVVGVELMALASPDRRWVLVMSGVAAACALLALRWYLARESDADPEEPRADDAAESLRRWLSRTETLVSWAEATRKDWDRHLRPMLARQFEMATGQKRIKDRAAYHATGQMLFGADLWTGWTRRTSREAA